ncbi:hypothetical protein E2C01_069918 [Portunus trituberculatus]|uniref:Uncharacterized protein n=1 Tax=Portunus trituberculatus TaxID=210409 RepID=A0A5B7I3R7_PORTR|nr:hypothetical protein [Portunus trituberculatus]
MNRQTTLGFIPAVSCTPHPIRLPAKQSSRTLNTRHNTSHQNILPFVSELYTQVFPQIFSTVPLSIREEPQMG